MGNITRTRVESGEVKMVHGVAIEKNVPLPQSRRPRVLMDILGALEVGESFVWRARVIVREYLKKFPDRRFHCRVIGQGKFRVWRTK